jgi:hypothetical protein
MFPIFILILLPLILSSLQINLYDTDSVSNNDKALQYNCLRIAVGNETIKNHHEIVTYCMNEFSSKFNIQNDYFFPKFTFHELSQKNFTNQQLYLWSAPIDLIENYQFYLNQLSRINDLSLATKMFYNCTLPRFGPMCQYQLVYEYSHHSSLNEIIKDFYDNYEYHPTDLTCYTHLKCHRGPLSVCLDWSEICDGKIDCLDGGLDEEQCWQLEINESEENEYRCKNGQCIPQSFYQDEDGADCVDFSDETSAPLSTKVFCEYNDPSSFACEDILGQNARVINSYVKKRTELLMKII